MRKKKKRFGFFDEIFDSFFEEFEELFSSEFPVSSGGYSISIYQTPEGTIVEAQVSDDVDAEEFKKILEQRYPGAKIIIKGGKKELIKRESGGSTEKKVTIRLTETEKEERVRREERDELSDLLSGGRRRVFIERDEE